MIDSIDALAVIGAALVVVAASVFWGWPGGVMALGVFLVCAAVILSRVKAAAPEDNNRSNRR